MRKLLFVLILITSVLSSNGQNYHPLLSDSCKWYYSSCFEGCWTQISYIDGDTIINGKTYYNFFLPDGYTFYHLGYMREDTLNKKIFFKGLSCCFGSDTSDFVYYDFNLVQGDSILLKIPRIDCYGCNDYFSGEIDTIGWYIIDSTSIVTTLVGDRKVLYLSQVDYHNKINWIEGIGFANYGSYSVSEWLNCFYRKGNLEYKWNPFGEDIECDYYVTEIKVNEINNNEILIGYDRKSENIKITKLDPSFYKEMYVSIYDVSGHLLKQNISKLDVIDINISDFQGGIYFVSVMCNDNLFTNKIVK